MPPKWLKYIMVVAFIHLLGITFLFLNVGQYPQLIGLGFLAYTLGLRHAFDADHIAAIDNTVRKMVQQKQEPAGVGLYFSLGHSTVVCIMAIVTIFSVAWAKQNLPQLQALGSIVGLIISGSFLILMGVLNFYIWLDVYSLFSKMRKGKYVLENAEEMLSGGFLTSRLAGPIFRLISKSWQVYPVGFLFGLGFDTASEIALFAISAAAAAKAMPVMVVLTFPILFAAGMSLMDTLDGIFMTTAYNWAFSTPLRKVYYNLTITGLSVIAAIFIGVIEITQVLSPKLGLTGGLWVWIQSLNFDILGYILVGLFFLCWIVSYSLWKLLRLETTLPLEEG